MGNKSRVIDGPVGGIITKMPEGPILFLGVMEELLVLAANQQFAAINEYRRQAGSLDKTVECVVSVGRLRNFPLPDSVTGSARKVGPYLHFNLTGQLHYSQEGLVFGFLPVPPA